MTDIQNPKILYFKGALMLLTGSLAAILVIAQAPSLTMALLLAICVWGFCRAYYFAFYVIEHYIDPGYKYAGLIDFFRNGLRRSSKVNRANEQEPKSKL
ncbi:MAG: hypothetical protein ACK480_05820 [Planctomycetota bacterium]|jgi:uncharacterized RDD family membrane protein YckC